MNSFFKKIKILITDKILRNKILFVIAALAVFRFMAAIPVPGVDISRLHQFLANNQFLGLFNVLSGGGLSTFSIVMLGVGPYITAAIIMQVMSMMVPSLKELMQESGEAGRKTFNQYIRLLSVPISILQAFSFIKYLQSQGAIGVLSPTSLISNIVIITAGSVAVMWIGELINEFGIGSGSSIIILAGILAVIPPKISQFLFTLTPAQIPVVLLYLGLALLVIAGVVYIYESERPVKVTYARQVRGIRTLGGNESYLPLRLTQAGVMPLIFASSLLLFPQFLVGVFQTSHSVRLQTISHSVGAFLQNTVAYSAIYFLLVVFFTFFYTAVTFDPKQISTNLQKNGAFVPGIRPGDATMNYLAKIVTRITLVGSIFLGLVAILPIVVQSSTGVQAFALGGTSLLIVVSVVIDLVRRVDAQVTMQEY